jgi:hypothetical protein
MIGLITGLSGVAMAHELPGDETLVSQLAHQLLSLHHLPALVLMLVAAVIIYRQRGRNQSSSEEI